jgi:hypothetical protein
MTHHRDYRGLISMGRKAGLRTTELYQAMAGHLRDAAGGDARTDGNGFVSDIGPDGRRRFRPLSRSERN